PASTASMSRASCLADSPPVCGQTFAPRSTATVTAVEKDSTSTTTTTSLRSARVRAPTGPHSSATGMRRSVTAPWHGAPGTTDLRPNGRRRAPNAQGSALGRLGKLQPALLQAEPLVGHRAQARVEVQHALVVGRRRGELLVQ